MASTDWLTIYRTYSAAELAEEVTWLKVQMRNPFNAQGVGSKNYQRDVGELRGRLQAAIRVQQERGTSASQTPMERGDWGVPDFSSARF